MITERQVKRRRWLLRILIVLAILPAIIWGVVPTEPVDPAVTFDPASLGDDPVGAFLAREEAFDDITPGAERAVIWAGEEGETTDIVLVYLHGFSATPAEIRPVPERLGAELGANLVYTRLTGHGRGSDAMADTSVADWMHDADEALAVARSIGERVVIMGTSTGGTLAAYALANAREAEGVIFISPNFRIGNPTSLVLTLPGARHWVPPLFGRTRSWEPQSEDHGRFWTTSYPTEALFPMAALVEATSLVDHGAITTPALFYFSDADTVVDHVRTREIAEDWGGPATIMPVELTPGDDPFNHVIAGDILSPGRNDATVSDLAAWVSSLEE